MSTSQIGRPRAAVAAMPAYRPGKSAAQAEQEHGVTDAIKLASNENPDAPTDPIVAAVVAAATGLNRYADHRATELRRRLAEHLAVEPNQVTVGNGSVGLLQQICLSYLDPGDAVVYPWRSFEVYPVFARLMNANPVAVPLTSDLGVDVEALIAAATNDTKLIFVATPNNPTGVATTTTALRTLLGAVSASTIVCIDEAYREFVDSEFGDPIQELLGEYPNAIVTRTFSKAHGLAGARVGYAVGHPDVIATIDKTQLPFAVNAVAQAAALAALDHLDLVAASATTIVAERVRLETELAAQGWQLPRHQANFIWLATGERTDSIALELERRGVVVRPFSGDGIRVTVGSAAQNDRFLMILETIG